MKNFKKISCFELLVMTFIIVGCQSKFKYNIEKNENGVTIHHDSIDIKIEVVNESIIHVNKIMTGSTPSTIPDYVTVLEPQDVLWKMKESKDQVIISTNNLKVLVSSEGIIEYQTKDDKNLLAETGQNTFIHAETSKTHRVSQAFHAEEEGLYGLGQFQSGIMNWKNVPIRLQQYNQEIAIPFLVSTKGYGIYWNNYSITDFNFAENEIEFTTFNKSQTANDTNEAVATEKENVVEYVSAVNEEKNIRETVFTPTKTGEYYFMALSDNGGRMRGEIKVTIGGENVINYSTIWVPTRYSGKKYLEAGKEYKVVFQNTGAKIPGKLFYNEPDFNKTVFSSLAGNAIDYYFVYGEKPSEVISEYQHLTGKAPMFAKSAYGFWQCRERYHNQAELLENAREMRKRKIPFDNIVQDWFYWPDGTKGPEWDRAKYPDPKAMVDELKNLNLKVMVSVWPEVKHKPLEEKYNLTKVKNSHKLDFHDKGVQERYYKMLSDSMFQIGINSIWLDGTEPAGKPSSDIQTAVGPNDEVYNTYSLLVTKSVYEGRRKEFPNERVFNLTRSAYAGQQRYGATSWSGDVQSTWEQFGEQIPAGLNFVMAGVPYWTHDIGGFFRDSNSLNPMYDNQYTNQEFIELLTRWFQFGTFSPIFRIHGYVSETEIWRYGQAFEDTARKFIDLRYQLMPYIYSEAWKVTNEGKLLMSPLVYYYPNDKNTWEIKDQLFFGESIMVGFITEYKQRSKEMYLPKGSWYNFWTNEKVQGGRKVVIEAPLDKTPMFVKAGSILPMGQKVQYASQKFDEPLQLHIYSGADGYFELYNDDGESYAYEEGAQSLVPIKYLDTDQLLIIDDAVGDFMNYKSGNQNFAIYLDGVKTENVISYNGTKVEVQLKK